MQIFAKKSPKLSLKQVKQLPISSLLRFISKAKKYLKSDETWKKMCQDYNQDPSIVDLIPTKFGNIDVSAKTDQGVVILNYKLLSEGDFPKNYSYLIHEYQHWFQQCFGETGTKSSDDGNYLQNPYEQEAFQKQVSFISDNLGKEDAQEYVDDLLEYHEVDNKKEEKELNNKLMEEA